MELLTILMTWTPKPRQGLSGKRLINHQDSVAFANKRDLNHENAGLEPGNPLHRALKLQIIPLNVGRRP
jgi:hypothetical protein